jgi:hypothetical protein
MTEELDDRSEVLTSEDLQRRFKIPRSSQKDLRARGGFIPHFRVGRRVLYRKDAVVQWVAEQEAKARGIGDVAVVSHPSSSDDIATRSDDSRE